MSGFGYGTGFDNVFPVIFQVMFFLVFALVIGVFITVFTRGIAQWRKNNRSPRLTVGAKVVSRRENYRRGARNASTGVGGMGHTSYYATFEVESGDRLELSLAGEEYGMLAEGDVGRLTFQGTRYLGFERQ